MKGKKQRTNVENFLRLLASFFLLNCFSSPFPHKYTQPLMLAAVNLRAAKQKSMKIFMSVLRARGK
jgi:hypothetical protein